MHFSARWHRRGGDLRAGHRQPGGHRQRGRDRLLGLRCAGPVADEGSYMSVADIVDDESLGKVRSYKQALKAAAKAQPVS